MADTGVNNQLLSNFEAEIVADTKPLEAQQKNGVAYKKTCTSILSFCPSSVTSLCG